MSNRGVYRLQLLAGAATSAFLLFSAPAMAQNAAPETVDVAGAEDEEATMETITVKGIRASIQNSLDTKRNASSIVEAISAEDIGKLPDLSIADSLARLPGVTAQRVRGRSQQISIRGLGPDFSLALLNGREIVSAGNNRGVEFDQFPSELIAQGLVYKTPDARLAATGIAGAVDLQTVSPLDYDERRINLSGRYVVNDNGQLNPDFDDDGYRFFGSYLDQNAAGTVGWSLGATFQSNPTQYFSRELKTNGGQTSIDPATGLVYPADNPRTGVVSRDFERMSIAGALEFEPNDRWQTSIDAFYTDTEDSGIFRGVETPIASWSGAQFIGTAGNGPFASSSAFGSVVPILRSDEEGNTAEIWAFGINSSYEVTDRLTLTGDISRSTLDRNDIDYESYAGTGRARSGAQDTLVYQTPDSGEYRIDNELDYTDPGLVLLTDPGGWGQVGFIKEPIIEDELDQIRGEAEYELDTPFIESVVGGVLFTQREKTFDSNESFLRPTDAFGDGLAIPANAIVGATDSGNIGLDIIAYNTSGLINDGTYIVEKAAFDTEWSVEEEISTIYGMVNLDTDVSGVPMRGNIGFQFIDTEQASTGTLAGGGLQTVEESYTNFLPSLNLSFEVAEDTLIRASAAQTLTRPRLDQLAANQDIKRNALVCIDTDTDDSPDAIVPPLDPQIGRSCYTLNGGNPFLQPYQSTSFDLSFERYFSSASAFAVAVFHKDLSDWVVDRSTVVNASQQITAIGEADFLAANPEIAATQLSGPVNFADGNITGIEATLRLSLDDYLPEQFAGFGFNASYTYADNGLEDENGQELAIPGYSDTVWSTDFYYENHGWRARVSARYRSDFLSEVQNFDGSLSGAQALEETIVDLQVGYEWDSGALEGFGVNFEVFNLTDEPFVTENETALEGVSFPSRHELYGTTYNLTVTKAF